MKAKPVLSLCMPTNGVSEWVFPVLKSIEQQCVSSSKYEIVITDNGNSLEFKTKIKDYLRNHNNVIYAETQALPFVNEIESYKRANGLLIKFINHRTRLIDGALQRLIDFAEENKIEKPIVYFTNGVLKRENKQYRYKNFEEFVRNLSYWSSWSTGMTIWNSDFEKLPQDTNSFNELFPHTTVLFAERNRGEYVIDNTVIFDEISQGNRPKGEYDLFGAFGIEYPGIIYDLLRDGDISSRTFRRVVNDNLTFVASLYVDYFICKRYCSYELNGLNNIYGIFYTRSQFYKRVLYIILKRVINKIVRHYTGRR